MNLSKAWNAELEATSFFCCLKSYKGSVISRATAQGEIFFNQSFQKFGSKMFNLGLQLVHDIETSKIFEFKFSKSFAMMFLLNQK